MRIARVFVNQIEAGILTEFDSPREYTFKYNRDYLDKGYPAVSLTMPVQKEEYRSDHLFPFFFNMLSEGENRIMQASYHHLDKDDDFGILLATAQFDTPGNVTVKPL